MRRKVTYLVILSVLLLVGTVPALALGLRKTSTSTEAVHGVEFAGQIGGVSYTVAVQQNIAYLGVGPRMLTLDVSSPNKPTLMGNSSPLTNTIMDIDVSGDYAYVVSGKGGLQIFDTSVPSSPTLEKTLEPPLFALASTVQGDYVYVADLTGLQIVDVSNPTNPNEIGFFSTTSEARDVEVSGNYAYIAQDSDGVLVVDISAPDAPREVTTLTSFENAKKLDIANSYLYVADYNGGLRILDISDPTNVTEVGAFSSNYPTFVNVAVSGEYAYVADFNHGLYVVSVASPTNPVQVGFLNRHDYTNAVTVSGAYALIATHSGLQIVSVSNPSEPTQVTTYDTVGFVSGVDASLDRAYIAGSGLALHIVSTTNPQQPAVVARADADCAEDVLIEGDYAYVADCFRGLKIIGSVQNTTPSVIGSLSLPGWAYQVDISGMHAYVADGNQGLRVVDISDPTQPHEVGFYTTANARSVAVVEDHAYLADGTAGLRVIDVSDPSSPNEITLYETSGYARDVVIKGNHAYLADSAGGLRILDISEPRNPIEIGVYSSTYISSVTVEGNYAYLTGGDYFRLIDISQPESLQEIDFELLPNSAYDVAVANAHAYVASSSGGLVIFRITKSVTATIPETGGSLVSVYDDTTYTFPSGTFTDTVLVTHTITLPSALPDPRPRITIDHAFEVYGVYSDTNQSAEATQPYTVSIEYSENQRGSVVEESLGLYRWDESSSEWTQKGINSQVDRTRNLVIAQVDNFSMFAVLGETKRVYLPLSVKGH